MLSAVCVLSCAGKQQPQEEAEGGRRPGPAAHPVPRARQEECCKASRGHDAAQRGTQSDLCSSVPWHLHLSPAYCYANICLNHLLLPQQRSSAWKLQGHLPKRAATRYASVCRGSAAGRELQGCEPNRTTFPDHKGREFLPSTTRRGRKTISTTRDGPGGHCTLADQSNPIAAPVPGASDASRPLHALPSTLRLQSSIPDFPHLGPAVLFFIFNLKK